MEILMNFNDCLLNILLQVISFASLNDIKCGEEAWFRISWLMHIIN